MAPIAEQAQGGPYFMTARSYHAGVVNLARADGSVSAVSETIDRLRLPGAGQPRLGRSN